MSAPNTRSGGKRTSNAAGRGATPTRSAATPSAASEGGIAGRTRSQRSKSPQKQEQAPLPPLTAHNSVSYGAAGNPLLSASVTPSGDGNSFLNMFNSAVTGASNRDDNPGASVANKIPSTIAEDDDEEEEEGGGGDEGGSGRQNQAPPPPPTRTPANESTTFNREEVVTVAQTIELQSARFSKARTRALMAFAFVFTIMILMSLFKWAQVDFNADGSPSETITIDRASAFEKVKTYSDATLSNIVSWIPKWPQSATVNHTGDVYQRMSSLESTINGMSVNSRLLEASIQKLERILPDSVVVSKDSRGELQVPHAFWAALKDKLKEEFSDTPGQKVPTPDWDDFWAKNEAKVEILWAEQFHKTVEKAIEHERVLSKDAFYSLLDHNLRKFAGEMTRLQNEMEIKFGNLVQAYEAKGIAKAEKRFKEKIDQIPTITLSTLVHITLLKNAAHALNTVNHFSASLGAITDPYLTSATAKRVPAAYTSYMQELWFLFYNRWFAREATNPPFSVLEPWTEAGDCWCAAPAREMSHHELEYPERSLSRAQIGVIMPYPIYPTQVTVEHIPRAGSLDIGAAPRHMELWVYIGDERARDAITWDALDFYKRAAHYNSDRWQGYGRDGQAAGPVSGEPPREGGPPSTEVGFVRIATWKYDIYGTNHVQTFDVDVLLAKYGQPVTRAVIKVRGNWGQPYTCLYRVRMHGVVADGVLDNTVDQY